VGGEADADGFSCIRGQKWVGLREGEQEGHDPHRYFDATVSSRMLLFIEYVRTNLYSPPPRPSKTTVFEVGSPSSRRAYKGTFPLLVLAADVLRFNL